MNDVQLGVEDVSILSHGTFMLAEYLKHNESLKAIMNKPRRAALLSAVQILHLGNDPGFGISEYFYIKLSK